MNDVTKALKLFRMDGPSWFFWRMVLRVLFALPLSPAETTLALRHSGRRVLWTAPLHELWLCCGRRAGKSRALALIAVIVACFRTYPQLAAGEWGVVLCVAPSQRQARVLLGYVLGFLHSVPMLEQTIVRQTDEAVELANHILIEVRSKNPAHIRGSTIVAGLVDEFAFLPTEDSAQPDTELLAAIRPGMSTIKDALLICSSTPHAQRGEMFKAHQAHFGNDESAIGFFNASSLVANPSLSASVVDQAYTEDPVIAASEFGVDGFVQFRTDCESFLPEEIIDSMINPDLPLFSGVEEVSA